METLSTGYHITVFAAEFIHPSGGVNNFLLAGIKGVAGGAYVNMQLLGAGGARHKCIAATAHYFNFIILGVYIRFHIKIRLISYQNVIAGVSHNLNFLRRTYNYIT